MGPSASLQIVATVDSVGMKTNVAEVQSVDQFDSDSTAGNSVTTEDDYATATIVPESVDLSVTKTIDNQTPDVGDTVALLVTVNNSGPADATGVSVLDTLPAGMSFVSATPSQGTFDSGSGVWAVGDLMNGAMATLQVNATVDQLGIKTSTAQVSAADQFDVDSTPANNAEGEDDQATVLIRSPRTLSKRLFLSR